MDIKKLITFLKNLGLPAKVIVTIIALLATIVVLFFTPGCAYKMHLDKLDNLTIESKIKDK